MEVSKMDLAAKCDFEIINGRKVVKKHIATIHCSNTLTLLERKISNVLLYNAFSNLKTTLTHEITLEQLKRLLNIKTRNHQILKGALKKLITTLIEWNVLGENVPELEGWNASTILSSVSINEGVVRYQYSELIKTLIIDPKIYGRINLIIQARFKSSYSLALYENCARYRGLKYTKNFSLAEFRMLMGLEEGKYEQYRDLNRRVLSIAIAEINTCSDIRIAPDITKKGRKIVSIKFRIEERKMKPRFMVSEEPKNNQVGKHKIEKTANELLADPNSLMKFYQEYGEEKVDKAIEYIRKSSSFNSGVINNINGYIKSALENNYEKPLLNNDREIKNKVEINNEIDGTFVQEYFDSYLPNELFKQFNKLSSDQKKSIEEDFILNGTSFHKNHIKTALNKGSSDIFIFLQGLSSFIYNRYPNLLNGLKLLDNFLLQKKSENTK